MPCDARSTFQHQFEALPVWHAERYLVVETEHRLSRNTEAARGSDDSLAATAQRVGLYNCTK